MDRGRLFIAFLLGYMRLQVCPLQDPILVGAAGAFPASKCSFWLTGDPPGPGPSGRCACLTSTVGPPRKGVQSTHPRMVSGILGNPGPFEPPSAPSGALRALRAAFGPSGSLRATFGPFGGPLGRLRPLRVPSGPLRPLWDPSSTGPLRPTGCPAGWTRSCSPGRGGRWAAPMTA